LRLFKEAVDTLRRRPLNKSLSMGLMGLASAYQKTKNYKHALRYANEGLLLAKARNEWELTLEGYNLLSRLYDKTGMYQSAYTNLRKYTSLKDSVINKQFLWRLSNYKRLAEDEKRTSQISLFNKENQLKEQNFRQQLFIRNTLIGGFVLLFLIGVFAFRNLHLKRKNEKLRLQKDLLQSEQRQIELQRQTVELEMQALRAQMNPHFIFNCLSSINRFIFKNDNKAASDYLTRFSRLIRMVLLNSQKKLITLEDELEMLRLYLDMERMRFKNGFVYSITTNNTIDAGAIFIPPLLLQPFCENAIWHGLMNKEGQGHLNISITEDENVLHCTITDDGVGREKAAIMKSKSAEKEKSLGLKITTARLELLNQEHTKGTTFIIEDVLDENGGIAGTRVHLKICYKESIEEAEHA
ncbi:MAG: sensor histidine kinase, partial [Chitinophagaceae bacterium]